MCKLCSYWAKVKRERVVHRSRYEEEREEGGRGKGRGGKSERRGKKGEGERERSEVEGKERGDAVREGKRER